MLPIDRLLQCVMVAGLALGVAGAWHKDTLPDAGVLRAELDAWPDQAVTDRAPFQVRVGGVEYTVRPLHRYDLHGLVVTMHAADSFTDWVHKAWNDHLNVVDLCVVYGSMARAGVYHAFSWSSGNFTCNFQGLRNADWSGFVNEEVSNNHVLTASPTLAKRLRDVRIGDQVRLTGYLAEYTHSATRTGHPFHRGTSTTRSDTGNQACETVYVEDVEILRRASQAWRVTMWGGIALLLAGIVGWFCVPYRARD